MAENKKIVISLPKSLLQEFDELMDSEKCDNRNQLIREAVMLYISERKKIKMRELMKKGYQDMSEINSELAECGMKYDFVEFEQYEAGLAESDLLDGSGGEKRRYILC